MKTKNEIKIITNTMLEKRKSLISSINRFLTIWESRTKEQLPGYETLFLFSNDYNSAQNYFIRRNNRDLFEMFFYGAEIKIDISALNINKLIKLSGLISFRVPEYFKKIEILSKNIHRSDILFMKFLDEFERRPKK